MQEVYGVIWLARKVRFHARLVVWGDSAGPNTG